MILARIVLVLCALIFVSHAKLYQAFVFFRHGARYHTNDLYDANATYPIRAELTPIGMKMH